MNPVSRSGVLIAFVCLCAAVPRARSEPQKPARAPLGELDAFMEKVLARRAVNRQMLNDYILDEVEDFEVLGPGRYPFVRMKREFTWYVRDGMHVRSPVKFDGVEVSEADRKRYEDDWIRREKARRERRAKKEKENNEIVVSGSGVRVEGGTALPTEPRFVSEAYFMDFKFEPGNYYLAGREQLEGHDVLRIEYYPSRLFDDDDKKTPKEMRRGSKEKRADEDIDRRMNKTALITLWVDPNEHQIVKYTFDNVWLDFLPGAWLVRVDDIRASMTMGQPFAGVWLPRDMNIHAGITLANGSFEAGYTRTFSGYREADVTTKIRIPKLVLRVQQVPQVLQVRVPQVPVPQVRVPQVRVPQVRQVPVPQVRVPQVRQVRVPQVRQVLPHAGETGHGPYVQDAQPQGEVIREIRVHGNAFLTDAEVLKLAGVAVGQEFEPGTIEAVERRLKSSGRFESIEVRKRYRSLTDLSDVALILVVHEKPGVRSSAEGKPVFRPFGKLTSRMMFLPILGYADGYGFTYGGRVSTVDVLGIGERLSVPATWGGTRRIALEFDRGFKRGPLTRIQSSAALWQRENPHFEIADRRIEVKARAERQIAGVLRAGVDASRSSVTFGALDDTLWTLGTNIVLDTALDPAFPANAVRLGAGWTGLHVTPGAIGSALPRIDLYTTEARGYLRVFRQAVAAGRVQYSAANATLPPYERLLLGGASTLRGFRAGTFIGDRMLVTSAELRVPLTTVLSSAKFGVTAFFDAAKAYDYDQRLRDTSWHRGAGGGIFVITRIVNINLDVAHGINGGDTRLHLATGFSF